MIWTLIATSLLSASSHAQEPIFPQPPTSPSSGFEKVPLSDSVFAFSIPPFETSADSQFIDLILGYKTWLSVGRSTTSMEGMGGYPNILAELKWRRLVNPIQEVHAETVWGGRFIARADFGFGTGGSGRLSNRDYDDDNRASLTFASTHPASDDNIFYMNLDLGWRFVDYRTPEMNFRLDALLGYQHWREKYIAYAGQQTFPDAAAYPPGRVLSNRFRWDSFRIGGRAEMELSRLTVGAKLMLVPANSFRNDDIHYLRDDLLQDPSFIDEATGGFGLMLDATVSYRIWRGLSLEAGYRVWYNEGGLGLTTARAIDGDVVSPLHHAYTLRQGILLGLLYKF